VDWNVLAQRKMSASLVAVRQIRLQVSPQVGFPEDDHMVEAFSPDRADEPLNVSNLPGRPWCRGSIPDAHCSQTPDDCIAVNCISISHHVLRSFIPREGINYLSCHPLGSCEELQSENGRNLDLRRHYILGFLSFRDKPGTKTMLQWPFSTRFAQLYSWRVARLRTATS
jgi:hypothetical protein